LNTSVHLSLQNYSYNALLCSVNAQHKCRQYCTTLPNFKYCGDNLAITFKTKARTTNSDCDPEGQARTKASDSVTVGQCRCI